MQLTDYEVKTLILWVEQKKTQKDTNFMIFFLFGYNIEKYRKHKSLITHFPRLHLYSSLQ